MQEINICATLKR